MKGKAKKKAYELRASISEESGAIINKVQGRLALDGKENNIPDAVNEICKKYAELTKLN